MDISIIIVNYKTKDLTINAITSVIEKTKGISYEIFVVDNNSQDGSIEEIEKSFPDINIIKNPVNSGFGAANNLAIKQSHGKYILCLNPDTLLINNAIKIMFDYMESEENQKTAVCGGALYDEQNNPCACCGHLPSFTGILWKIGVRNFFKKTYTGNFSLVMTVEDLSPNSDNIGYISGADIFFRKSVLEETGLFDEQFFMYYEETDLCKRIKDKGYAVRLIPKAKITHLEGKSSNNRLLAMQRSKKSEFYYFKKHDRYAAIWLKPVYLFLYFIDGYILNHKISAEMLKFIWEL